MRRKPNNKGNRQSINSQSRIRAFQRTIIAGLWTQVIGQILEGVGVAEELFWLEQEERDRVKPRRRYLEGARKGFIGVWVQVIGQVLETEGAIRQQSDNERRQYEGRILAIQGNWLQSLGSAMEAIGGTMMLQDAFPGERFIL